MSKKTPGANTPELPKSCTSMWINFIGVFGFLLAIYIMRGHPSLSGLQKLGISILSYALPIALLECFFLKTFRRASTGYNLSTVKKLHWKNVATKLLGFYLTLAIVGATYSVFPEYQGGILGFMLYPEQYSGGFYRPFWEFLSLILPYVLIGAIPYFIYLERFSEKPEDGYWQTGLLLLLRFDEVKWKKLGQHFLGWTVKFFFLPLMYVYLLGNVNYLINVNVEQAFANFNTAFNFFWQLLYGVDLIIVTVGYITAVRLLDSHIRSTEPTVAGWVFALMCYQPFWSLISTNYLNYDSDGFTWGTWLFGHTIVYTTWGCLILFLTAVYAYASVSFGLRFSNLTNRGILTNGAYRFTKHPAYVSKNLSWWMIAVPFIIHSNTSTSIALGSCAMLFGVNVIYYMRARTEERHLSSDPVYVEYALAMNERSMFSWLGKLFPALQYKPFAKLVDIE